MAKMKFDKEMKKLMLDDYRDYLETKGKSSQEIERMVEEMKKDPEGYMKLYAGGCGW